MSAFTATTASNLQKHYGKAQLLDPDETTQILVFPFPFADEVDTAIIIHPEGGLVIKDYGKEATGQYDISVQAAINTPEDVYAAVHQLVIKMQKQHQENYAEELEAVRSVFPTKAEALEAQRENYPDHWEENMINAIFTPCKNPSFSFDPFDL